MMVTIFVNMAYECLTVFVTTWEGGCISQGSLE